MTKDYWVGGGLEQSYALELQLLFGPASAGRWWLATTYSLVKTGGGWLGLVFQIRTDKGFWFPLASLDLQKGLSTPCPLTRLKHQHS